ncbi:MAG: VanZ family protein [Gemmatimonadota bacterium]|nr:VanZ family protein [Gemmatimonadota bacterium]
MSSPPPPARIDRRLAAALRAAMVVIICIATLVGLDPDWSVADAIGRLGRALLPRLVPSDVIDGLRNLVLFAALGVAWRITTERRDDRAALRQVVLVGFGLSVAIEVIQAISPVRNSSVIDVITDTLGTWIGAALMTRLIRAMAAARGRPSYFGVPAWLLAGPYGIAVVCEAVGPLFRQERLPLSGSPLLRVDAALRLAHLLPSSPIVWADVMLDAVLFAPAGALAYAALAERRYTPRRALWEIALVSTVAMTLAELVHGVFSMEIVPLAMIAHVGGVVAGAVIAARSLAAFSRARRGAARARVIYVCYAIWICLWSLRPFKPDLDGSDLAQQLDATRLVPMLSLAGRQDLYSVTHVGVVCALFVPIGAMLAVWPLRRSGALANLRPALAAAVLLELGHLVIAGRYFDLTNMLLSAAGVALGWLLTHHGGLGTYGEALPQ